MSRSSRLVHRALTAGFLAAAACVIETHPADAAQVTVIYRFSGPDGSGPTTDLLAGPGGTLFGATYAGGAWGWGTVFELAPPAAGRTAWTETVLYSFHPFVGGNTYPYRDGAQPDSNLVMDKAGNLYGTTFRGGAYSFGTVFRLTPPASGKTAWTETILYSRFNNDGVHAIEPQGRIYVDSSGRLFGTTAGGGGGNGGVAYALVPGASASKPWIFTVLSTFQELNASTDGSQPTGGLSLAADGSFYGTTFEGGANYDGTLFRLTPPAVGQSAWTRQTLYNFGAPGVYPPPPNGSLPSAAPRADRSLHLFGTAVGGGAGDTGVVYRLSPPVPPHTAWTQSVLYSFGLLGTGDGSEPRGEIYEDNQGRLYGTTSSGGSSTACNEGCGTVFRLTPRDEGGHLTPWNKITLHEFNGVEDGANPSASLVSNVLPDGISALFGTAAFGSVVTGPRGYGTVFEIIP